MNEILFGLVAGVGVGGLYALMGQGLVVAFRGSGVVNFAHGAIAAYTAYVFNEFRAGGSGDIELPWIDPIPEWGVLKSLGINNLPQTIHVQDDPGTALSVVVALAVAALIGVMMHLLVFRPLRNAPALAKIIGSVGVLLYLQSVAVLNFGSENRSDTGWWLFTSDTTKAKPIENVLGLGSTLPLSSLVVAGTAVVVGFVLWALFRWTRFGIATRAANENEKGAVLLGYSTQRLAGLNWILSSVLAGFAGIVFISNTQPGQLTLFVIAGLSAALVGNLTSIVGTTVGGLAIGMLASGGAAVAAKGWWPESVPAEGLRQVVPLAVIIVVLYVRGDRLPVRGSVSVGRQPRAPQPRHGLAGVVVAFAGVALLSNIFTGSWESALTTSLLFVLFMLSLVVLVGYLGQVSLAHWSLAGVAAWTVARVSADGDLARPFDTIAKEGPGLPTPLAMAVGVAAAVVVGVIIGVPALRIRGVQLAVATLASVVAIEHLILRNTWLMGEGAAEQNPAPIPSFAGHAVGPTDPSTQQTDYWRYTVFLLVVTVVAGAVVVAVRRGAMGRQFLAVRANERAAAAAGVNVAMVKVVGFALSSAIAGLAGVMYAYKLPSLSTENFNMFPGLVLLAFVYLGGITRLWGAVLGGWLAAGGVFAEFSHLHFEAVDPAIINLLGAVGLIANAVVTHGEGIAALTAGQLEHVTGRLRRQPTPERPDTAALGPVPIAAPDEGKEAVTA